MLLRRTEEEGSGRRHDRSLTFDGRFIGVTPVNRDRFGKPIAADRLFQKAQCGLCVPVQTPPRHPLRQCIIKLTG